jgi:hypothetical protein
VKDNEELKTIIEAAQKPESEKVRVTFYIERQLYENFMAFADSVNVKYSNLLSEVIKSFLHKARKPPPSND